MVRWKQAEQQLPRGPEMDTITAQVSLYPLREQSIGLPIREAMRVFRQHGLGIRVGEMSTLAWGE